VYAALAVGVGALYTGLREGAAPEPGAARRPLARSRRIVLQLSALFALDSFASGFVVQSLLALWLYRRFGLSVQQAGAIFFAAGSLNAFSQLLSARIAERIGLVQTMVFTHLPANVFLVLAAFMPNAPLAVTFLLLRTLFSQMDVPARQSYVVSVVPPEERAAAASVTNVPRSLAAACSPLLAGVLLEHSSSGWPLVLAGALKIAYDLLLLARFRAVQPADEDA
jgi:predicted MFS family arabinose efflux permease